MAILIGLCGIAVILAIAILFSSNRRAIRPRVVISAFLLQAGIALLVLKIPLGKAIISTMAMMKLRWSCGSIPWFMSSSAVYTY